MCWEPDHRFGVDDRVDRLFAYRQIVREGTPADQQALLDAVNLSADCNSGVSVLSEQAWHPCSHVCPSSFRAEGASIAPLGPATSALNLQVVQCRHRGGTAQ